MTILGNSLDANGLQWGRVVIDAESTIPLAYGSDAAGLQWGRVVIDAERFPRDRAVARTAELQWGRVVIDAERLRAVADCTVTRVGFNGAAS